MKNTALTFLQRKNKQPSFFSNFYPIYNQERNHLKPLSGNVYNISIKQIHQNDTEQIKQHLFTSCLTLNSDQFIKFSEQQFHLSNT